MSEPTPTTCARCGQRTQRGWLMRQRLAFTDGGEGHNEQAWCSRCVQDWRQAKEAAEFERSVAFGPYPRSEG